MWGEILAGLIASAILFATINLDLFLPKKEE